MRNKILKLGATGLLSMYMAACSDSSRIVESQPAANPAQDTAIWSRGGQWPVDEMGRTRIYHGFNIVRKFAPFYEERFGEDDAALLASEGFNAARIGFIWEGVEPQPGVYDDNYIQKILDTNTLMAKYGIRTLVDYHQDAWSERFTGDGAPDWATLHTLSPAPTANVGAGEAFAAFWRDEPAADGIGIQTHYINSWRHVVPFLRNSKNVLGFDIFNEPYPGTDYGNYFGLAGDCGFFSGCPEFESGALSDFSERMIAAIRQLDPHHTIYVEPIAGNNHEIALRKFSDSNLSLSYHTYCTPVPFLAQILPNFITQQYEASLCPQTEIDGIEFGLTYAKSNATIASMTEWANNDDEADNARMTDLMGKRLLPWTRWQYYTKPAVILETGANAGVLVDDEAPASQDNINQTIFDSLVVPYPVATAGTPSEYTFDRATNVMSFKYSPAAAGRPLAPGANTLIFVPKRKFPTGYQVEVTGGRVVSSPTAAYLEIATNKAVESVLIKVSPSSSSRTEYPTTEELKSL